ncbi:MAG: hypothetical protein EA379_01495 [Phycisphaerales bacterium]|nr:MAG: hypothetical protein EA379_01495 [Phycisphaerales bacterium]
MQYWSMLHVDQGMSHTLHTESLMTRSLTRRARRLLAAAMLAAAAPMSSGQSESDWSTVTEPVTAYLQARPFLQGASLAVFQADDLMHEQQWGSYTADTVVPIASASKLLSAVAILSLVDDGFIDLDAPVSAYLPADFPPGTLKGSMTVRQMFSHTAGLPSQSPYISDLTITLAQCVALIGQNTPLLAQPGSVFSYGGVSMQVAGRVAEVAAGQPWATLFHERVAAPLGLTSTDYAGLGQTLNPRIGGGARSSTNDLLRVLEMINNQGDFRGVRVLNEASVGEMLSDQTNGAPTGFVPDSIGEYKGYGIGVWIELRDDDTGEPTEFSSPGGAGTTPWINPGLRVYGAFVIDANLSSIDPLIDEIREFARLAASSCVLAGDANGDGVVDFSDLSIVLGDFGQTGAHLAGDLTGDGQVNFADLSVVLGDFGVNCE